MISAARIKVNNKVESMPYVQTAFRAIRKFQRGVDYSLDLIVKHGRNAEWALVLAAVLFANAYAEPGETLTLKIYENVRALGMTDARLVWILSIAASVHGMGLLYNGAVKRTPTWRGACCFLHAIVFGLLGYLTYTSSMKASGVLPYCFMVLAFLAITCCRIAGDDRKCLMQR